MSSGGSVTIVSNRLPAIAKAIEKGVPLVIAKGAHDVEGAAKGNAPVDTGNLRNSITAEELSALLWIVYVGATYGIYVEMGTYRMGAQPYLLPGFMAVQGSIVSAIEGLIKSL